MSDVVLWVDGFGLGRQRLLGGGDPPWRELSALPAFHAKLDELLGGDVLGLPLDDCYATWWVQAPHELLAADEGGRSGAALKAMLGAPGPRAALMEIIAAVGDRRPVGLQVPAPSVWAGQIAQLAGERRADAADRPIADRAAAYVAALLRALGGAPVTYLLVGDESGVDACELDPLVRVAEHYRWRVGVHGDPGPAHFSVTAVGEGFWTNGQLPQGDPPFYVHVPDDADPETVLNGMSVLRQGVHR